MAEASERFRRLRDDVTDRLAHLVALAADTGGQVGETSRQRAIEALHALQGRRRYRRRWLLLGLVLGFAAGVGVAEAVRRNQQLLTTDTGADTARAMAAKIRDTAAPARHAATKIRDRVTDTGTGSNMSADADTNGEDPPGHPVR